MQRPLNISREQLTRQTQPLFEALGAVHGISPSFISGFGCFAGFLVFQLSQQLLPQRAIAPRRQAQNFAPDVCSTCYRGIPGFGLLLFDLFQCYSPAVLIDQLRSLPRLAKESASSVLIGIPKRVGDPCLGARAQFLIVVAARVGGQGNQKRLRLRPALPQNSLGFRIGAGLSLGDFLSRDSFIGFVWLGGGSCAEEKQAEQDRQGTTIHSWPPECWID